MFGLTRCRERRIPDVRTRRAFGPTILSLGCFTTQERGFWQARDLLYLAPRRNHDQPPAAISVRHRDSFDAMAAPFHDAPRLALRARPYCEDSRRAFDSSRQSL